MTLPRTFDGEGDDDAGGVFRPVDLVLHLDQHTDPPVDHLGRDGHGAAGGDGPFGRQLQPAVGGRGRAGVSVHPQRVARDVLVLERQHFQIAGRNWKADHPLFDWLINCVILNHF